MDKDEIQITSADSIMGKIISSPALQGIYDRGYRDGLKKAIEILDECKDDKAYRKYVDYASLYLEARAKLIHQSLKSLET